MGVLMVGEERKHESAFGKETVGEQNFLLSATTRGLSTEMDRGKKEDSDQTPLAP